jgi:hypothetical protein
MEFKKFLPGFLRRGEKIEKLKKKIREAREQLTNLMVEVFELRAKVREVLELVTERVGELEKKKELLINKVNFLRKRLASPVMDMREEDEQIWRQTEEKINREYREVFEKIKKEREFKDNENPKNKKLRLKKVWMKLVKIFHPDKHMNKEKDREIYEEMMVTVNQAKKEGNLEALEAIARDPEKFLREVGKKVKSSESKTSDHKGDNSKKSARDEEKELLMTLDILLEDIKKIRGEEKKLKKSADLTLWEMWKNRPGEFENTMREMESNLLIEIETLEKVLSKLMKKLDEKTKSGWNV